MAPFESFLPPPLLSQGDKSEPCTADAECEDENGGQSIQKREDPLDDLVLFLSEPGVVKFIRGLRGGIDARVVDVKGQVGR